MDRARGWGLLRCGRNFLRDGCASGRRGAGQGGQMVRTVYSDSRMNLEDERQGTHASASGTEGPVTDAKDGEPVLHVVFVRPQIHWNTGNIGRTCLGLGARLHLVGPLGFSLDARQVRRAGLDYWEHVDVRVYADWEEFADTVLPKLGGKSGRFFFSKFGTVRADRVDWPRDGKIVLIFGSEVDGFDGIRHWLNSEGRDETVVAFPMVDDRFRSFNLSTSASMALWDAYKSVRIRACVDARWSL